MSNARKGSGSSYVKQPPKGLHTRVYEKRPVLVLQHTEPLEYISRHCVHHLNWGSFCPYTQRSAIYAEGKPSTAI